MDSTTGRKGNGMNPQTEALRQHAIDSHAAYSQYAGYFDGWELGTLRRRITTKGGTRLAAGTEVLTNFDRDDLDGKPVVSIYDPATTHIVIVDADRVARVEYVTRHATGLVTFG